MGPDGIGLDPMASGHPMPSGRFRCHCAENDRAASGGAIPYVFQTLDTKEYIMCTRLPNWKVPEIDIGDEGFLQYQVVSAGEEYFSVAEQKNVKYNYSNIYFNNFILKTENINNNKIIF